MRKSYFLAGGTPKNDDLLRKTAAQIATLHTATWCQTRTPRGGGGAQPHRKSPEQGGQRGCSLWKLACARSAYQNSLSILSCISAMHLPPPRTALAREPHATAPVPSPHDAHDAARAAYAYETGMRTQHRPATPARAPRGASWRVRNWYVYAGKLMYPGGVTATAPAETADCTRTAPAHRREPRFTFAAEECLMTDLL